ncbi:hypothetical protein WALSEDRAFT_60226 [Wallemia mellicola CBS 633.66]|uniref:Uncharacterized protein n=1 Tax=Wallemia mellicola (strain ATCC MYA-4683 / CBS 633.66) TaxID=671144 RepID=I4YCQ4_WALMC|nr:hypothetical protein WALSEDRAFT_60226 [Wallemia mellicola CBS 633.66]EIM21746.1 hypothetical protein WALSEDRAFT_60226 [Wallemia mellicola CBS 633.66]|eukprot:XP_006958057.1 hypothetical protein WALSEDRAFT_60226 [Wallemia mellicola CBS 633.66]
MPKELLNISPLYSLVGVYRLITDEKVRNPIWLICRKGLARGAISALLWSLSTWKIQKKIVATFMSNSPKVLQYTTKALENHIPLLTFATFMFVSAQATAILQFLLYKRIAESKKIAYDLTIQSRAKSDSFWGPYVEEYNLETESGKQLKLRAEKLATSRKTGWRGLFEGQKRSKLLNLFITKVILLPLDVLPGVGLLLGAALRSVALARRLLKPYFVKKGMTAYEQELFIQERSFELRSFGFMAALLERLPIVGLLCSIATPIAAAMMSVDFEKRQNELRGKSDADKERYENTHVDSLKHRSRSHDTDNVTLPGTL